MRHAFFAAFVFVAGCSYSPTAPTRMTLAISQSNLPVGGTAAVTASGAPDRALVTFSSSLGTFAPKDAYAVDGVARSTFTATRSGIGTISALSGAVSSEPLQLQIGEFPTLPMIDTTPAPPTVFLSCNTGIAGVPAICSVSGSNLQTIVINWGDGAPEQSFDGTISTVAHTFGRADRFTVHARGVDRVGQVAHASATATIVNPLPPLPDMPPPTPVLPPPPPPPPPPPVIVPTSVTMTQEADLGLGTCAAFNVSAIAATGTTIATIVVTNNAGATVASFAAASGRFAMCGLAPNAEILTALATDSSGGTASYPLVVR